MPRDRRTRGEPRSRNIRRPDERRRDRCGARSWEERGEFAREVSARRGGEGWKEKVHAAGQKREALKGRNSANRRMDRCRREAARRWSYRKARTESADSRAKGCAAPRDHGARIFRETKAAC